MSIADLRKKLIRNFNDVALETSNRAPHYDGSQSARLARGTVAQKLGASIDIVPAGKRSCPYHFHYVEEEMFIVLEGEGTLRVAGEMVAIREGDTIFIPPGPEYPHQILNTSTKPLKSPCRIGALQTAAPVPAAERARDSSQAPKINVLFPPLYLGNITGPPADAPNSLRTT